MLLYGATLYVCLLVQILGLLIFAKGFFPFKPILHGFASPSIDQPPAVFDKVIFVLIDALRSDFVFSDSSSMKFTNELISAGHALPYTARAAPPTVTLPRIKGLTTGSVPNFLDAVINIAESDDSSTLMNQDSWLMQFKIRKERESTKKNIIMFGDDTWLRLFPDIFDRYEGTTSFFVSDFKEVDDNVTRHLDIELHSNDWNVMIMHYLGLDHIGHKGGPYSPFMPAKQEEMDHIISRLYKHAEDRNSAGESILLVVCGDHGMNDVGNHGGSSDGETATALLFLSPLLSRTGPSFLNKKEPNAGLFEYYRIVEQVDMVPSLSVLMGNPIPQNSIGVIIPELLSLWSGSEALQLLRINARQIHKLLREAFSEIRTGKINSSSDDIKSLYALWSNISQGEADAEVSTLYEFMRLGAKVLSRTSSNYNMSEMIIGLIITSTCTAIQSYRLLYIFIENSVSWIVFAVINFLYCITMFASSLVEEEQYFWYWSASAWITICVIVGLRSKSYDYSWMFFVPILFVMRHYHHTGQKYAGSYDIVKYLQQDSNSGLLWMLFSLQLIIIFKNIQWYIFKGASSPVAFVGAFIVVTSIAYFKIASALEAGEVVPKTISILKFEGDETDLVFKAKTAFLALSMITIYHFVLRFSEETGRVQKDFLAGIHYIVESFLVIQTRIYVIPIFILYAAMHSVLRRLATRSNTMFPVNLAITTIIFQHFSYFAMGNSNSLASIDLSNAYNGISSYNVGMVGILTFMSNWAGPVYFSTAAASQLAVWKTSSNAKTSSLIAVYFSEYLPLIHVFHGMSLLAVLLACYTLRDHLFIWTVFSPKLLYTACWFLFQQIIIDSLFIPVTIYISGLARISS
ncbi:alkaline-phosphatase-like protein [Dipodascopsis uninucleata]